MQDDGISIDQPIHVHPADHQMFITFTDDLESEMFHDWLFGRGLDDFKQFKRDNEGDYQ